MKEYPKPSIGRIPFEIVGNNYSIWKSPNKIRSLNSVVSECTSCGCALVEDFTLIPVSPDKKAKVDGLFCSNCKLFYTTDAYYVELILHDNKYSRDFELDGEALWNISWRKEQKEKVEKKRKRKNQQKERLESVPSSEVMICVRFCDNQYKAIIVINDMRYVDDSKNILHYSSYEGREFLSAAYAEERSKEGLYKNRSFSVIELVHRLHDSNHFNKQIIPVTLNIKSGGGYATEIKNNLYEIVDMLVYSLKTNRYEMMRATYSKEGGFCFVDIGMFRRFVREHGRPSLSPQFELNNKSYFEDELKEESILKGYGYVVNKKDNLSTAYRQELLSEVIDLEIMSAPRIVKFLNWLIQTRPHQPDAQHVWREDMRFVENYKAHPERFLIAK